MATKFGADLGVGGATPAEVVEAACADLGGDGAGLSRAQKAEKAWDALYSGSDAQLAPRLARELLVELGRVVGAIDVEEVLDVLFRDFCIGK